MSLLKYVCAWENKNPKLNRESYCYNKFILCITNIMMNYDLILNIFKQTTEHVIQESGSKIVAVFKLIQIAYLLSDINM